MNRKSKEIACLNRLQETTHQLDNIVEFLLVEGLIDKQSIRETKSSPDYVKFIQETLRDLQNRQKLQLLEYEWNILPVEYIKIYLITDKNQMEFTFNC